MKRFWHIMKRTKSMSNPTNLLFFDTETKPILDEKDPNIEYHTLWFGYALAYRRDKRKRTRIEHVIFYTVGGFWNFVLSRLDRERPLWIFAHNLPFDLTIVDAWLSGDMYGIKVDLPVLDDPPLIIACSHKLGKLIFVDTFNYWKSSLVEIGKSIGREKLPMPESKVYSLEWSIYCVNDVEILADAIDKLIVWLEDNDLGSLRYTTPSIAMGVYKHKFMPENTILIHDNTSVLKLERESYHGGLMMPYYVGMCKEKLYKYDVNSLYPAMMKKQYPVRLTTTFKEIKPDLLREYMRNQGAVSMVSLDTKIDAYPVVWQKKLIEAVGRYTVPLCGQELLDALERNQVTHCYETAIYQMADIFSGYVDYFFNLRKKYKEEHDETGNLFCKLMLNSLYGKFGQQAHQWIDLTSNNLKIIYDIESLEMPILYLSEVDLPTWPIGVHHWRPLNYPHDLTIRQLPSSSQVKISGGEHKESSPIISAYVTSYARSHMRCLREIVGRRHVYYTDTDSLIVDKIGKKILEKNGFIDSEALGALKLEGESKHTIIYGPKDYVFGGHTTIKGIRKDAIDLGDGLFEQIQFEGLKSVLKREPSPYITIKKVRKQLTRTLTKGIRRRDGWVDYIKLELL